MKMGAIGPLTGGPFSCLAADLAAILVKPDGPAPEDHDRASGQQQQRQYHHGQRADDRNVVMRLRIRRETLMIDGEVIDLARETRRQRV